MRFRLPMTRPWLARLVVAGLAAWCAGAGGLRAQEMGAAERQDVVRVVREALVRDPSILREALAALAADDERRRVSVTRDVIAMLGPTIVDPADPVAGNPLGDVTVVEFYDTRCPFCRTMEGVVSALLREDGGVRLVVKDLPVLGPSSQLESRFLLAAQRQGGYFRMREAVMQLGGTSTRDSLREVAERVGLDGGRMAREVDDPAIKARLEGSREMARQLGIDGTPAYVIGTRLISGAAELEELQRAVREARGR